MHEYMYVCIHVCIACVYTCVQLCIHLCVYACMYICMHVCIHVCVYVILKLGFERYGGIVLVGRGNCPGGGNVRSPPSRQHRSTSRCLSQFLCLTWVWIRKPHTKTKPGPLSSVAVSNLVCAFLDEFKLRSRLSRESN